MKLEELKYLTDLYNSQLAISVNLWNFFIVVSLGFLGFVYSSKNISGATIAVLSVVFIGFGLSNLMMIGRTQSVLYESVEAISSFVENNQGKEKTYFPAAATKLEATEVKTVRKFHGIMMLAVLAGVWMPTLIGIINKFRK